MKTGSNEFNYLCENAFSFLEKSINEIKKDPKFSLIHFFTFIELILKSRLVAEHWSLIILNIDKVDKNKFSEGDFRSVDLEKCVARIKNIARDEIGKNAINSFQILKNHRNKIIHFMNPKYIKKEKTKIAIEQWKSWHYLHELFCGRWKDFFSNHTSAIELNHKKILRYKEFLKERFEELKSEMKCQKNQGIIFRKCGICNFKSRKQMKNESYGIIYKCIVCESNATYIPKINIKIPCPNCGNDYTISSSSEKGLLFEEYKTHGLVLNKDNIGHCVSCGETLEINQLLNLCVEHFLPINDPWYHDEMPSSAYCDTCKNDLPTTFLINDEWTCINCGDRGYTALECPHCGEFVTGDPDKIKYWACIRCEDDAHNKMEQLITSSKKNDI